MQPFMYQLMVTRNASDSGALPTAALILILCEANCISSLRSHSHVPSQMPAASVGLHRYVLGLLTEVNHERGFSVLCTFLGCLRKLYKEALLYICQVYALHRSSVFHPWSLSSSGKSLSAMAHSRSPVGLVQTCNSLYLGYHENITCCLRLCLSVHF